MKHVKKIVCSVTAIIAVVTGYTYSPSEESLPPTSVGMVTIDGDFIGVLHVSVKALELIGNAEACRRSPYTCPAGLATDGIGNTTNVTGEIKTDQQIAADWTRNIIQAEDCLFKNTDTRKMTQGQFDAFTSFVFNTGCSRFMKNPDGTRTRIYRKILNNQLTAACNELPFWVYGGGEKLPGLIIRRNKELELCLSPES